MKSKKIVTLIVSGLIGLAVIVFWVLGMFGMWENKILDIRFKMRGPIKTSEDIVIVAIDESSIEPKNLGRWPWSRNIHAKLVDRLTAAGAKAIVFDVLFPEPDKDKPWADAELGESVARSKKVVLACFFRMAEGGIPVNPLFPVKDINKSKGLGFTNIFTELDGVNRKIPLFMEYEKESIASLAMSGLSVFLGKSPKTLVKERRIKTDKYNEIYINFHGGFESFPYYSYYKVLNGEISNDKFKDKIVLIGGTAAGLFDFKAITYAPVFPGVEIHANTMSNILLKNYLRPWPAALTIIIIVLFVLYSGLFSVALSPLKGGVVTIATLVGYFYFVYFLFTKNIFAEFIAPASTLIISYMVVLSYRFMTEEREKRWIKKTFSHYLSATIMDKIISDPGALKLGGQRQNLTVLFSDIRGFTTMSEALKAEEVVELLNEYLGKMVEVVFRHEGTLDKFIGDAVMAFWGAPIPQKDHQIKAVLCAIDMIKELKILQAKWREEGKKVIEIGVGINTGEMVVGNMGSKEKMEYTVIGDNVNLGSRLESLNKSYHCRVIISEAVYERVKGLIDVKPLGSVKVKGKTKPITIYGIIGKKGDEPIIDEKEIVIPQEEPKKPEVKPQDTGKFDPDARIS